jgi:Tfp pilus assembly protein PilE
MNKIVQNQFGATLIELMISTALMILLTTSFYNLLLSFYKNYGLQEAIAEMQQEARVSDDLFSREVRQTGYDPTGTLFLSNHQANVAKTTKVFSKVACDIGEHPAERIFEATPTLFHYLADLNGSAVTNQEKDIDEDIRYEWVGPTGIDSCGNKKRAFTIYRDSGSGGGAQEVAFNIEAFKLSYFDEEGSELIGNLPAQALDLERRGRIKKVIMTLTVKSSLKKAADISQTNQTRKLTSEVWLKNM